MTWFERIARIAEQFLELAVEGRQPGDRRFADAKAVDFAGRRTCRDANRQRVEPLQRILVFGVGAGRFAILDNHGRLAAGSRTKICPSTGVWRNVRTKNANNWKAISSMAARFNVTSDSPCIRFLLLRISEVLAYT